MTFAPRSASIAVPNGPASAMVQSMNQIAHALDKKTIAEFVQNEKTLNILKDYGVDFAQGHHLGKPLPEIDTKQIYILNDGKPIVYN